MASLSFIIFCPLAAALVIALLPAGLRVLFRLLAIAGTFLALVGAARVFLGFEAGGAEFQFVEQADWIRALGAGYHLGVDGLNVGLLLMAAMVGFAAACVSWEIEHREKEYYILLLLITGGVLGTFVALDLLLFYVFHELALIPTFLM
ncbi:MAG: NADH-quinone oxidoreductase subunit M, partial [Verrucomicrobiae bacterium]|nr:NADH-quinone oxidoreductase subunit M [Verrucomicrobiae bacterium]